MESVVTKTKMQEWLDVLDSGEYAQTTNVLKKPNHLGGKDAYCCLGLAAEIVLGREFVGNGYSAELGDATVKLMSGLSPEDKGILGLDRHVTQEERDRIKTITGGKFPYMGERQAVLVELNDVYMYSFSQIADFIRVMGWDNAE